MLGQHVDGSRLSGANRPEIFTLSSHTAFYQRELTWTPKTASDSELCCVGTRRCKGGQWKRRAFARKRLNSVHVSLLINLGAAGSCSWGVTQSALNELLSKTRAQLRYVHTTLKPCGLQTAARCTGIDLKQHSMIGSDL